MNFQGTLHMSFYRYYALVLLLNAYANLLLFSMFIMMKISSDNTEKNDDICQTKIQIIATRIQLYLMIILYFSLN